MSANNLHEMQTGLALQPSELYPRPKLSKFTRGSRYRSKGAGFEHSDVLDDLVRALLPEMFIVLSCLSRSL